MSIAETPTTGETKVYDNRFRTQIPKSVAKDLGLKKGDKVKWVYQDGEVTVHKIPTDEN